MSFHEARFVCCACHSSYFAEKKEKEEENCSCRDLTGRHLFKFLAAAERLKHLQGEITRSTLMTTRVRAFVGWHFPTLCLFLCVCVCVYGEFPGLFSFPPSVLCVLRVLVLES